MANTVREVGKRQRLTIGEDVALALDQGRAVVALESTVLAHGLPRPKNLEVGKRLEELVRDGGATPATVGILDGEPIVGLPDHGLHRMATEEGILKCSTRDLALAVAKGVSGATTVAATAYLANAAGIEVFATGGIGGVHRGLPLDVSADLTEMQKTGILIVCAGAKSVLDVSATREVLETLGVLVLGWKTDRFPAFYTPSSREGVDQRVESAEEVAAIWEAKKRLGTPGAVLVCAPIPDEHALAEDQIRGSIDRALSDASSSGVRGKAITPFLLARVAEATAGASLQANVALLENNVRVATEIARALVAGR